jgi:arylsulfatase A-like enzyme
MGRIAMKRIVMAAVAWYAFAAIAAADPPGTTDRPNIVLVLADDLGINDLACYGRADHRTPNLDRLASQGMSFTCAYTAQPICSPSRAAIMTGKCPARLNLTNYLPGRPDAPSQRLLQPRIEGQLPLEEITIAELLNDAGYATGLFGKWHLGGEGFGPHEQGFDAVVSPPANTAATRASGGKGEFAITEAAEKFIEEHRDQPFFCYVPHNNPHIPLAAAPELVAQHGDAFHPVYAAMIETLDEAVGRLMAKVESLGLAERTIFIFTSDNGGLHVLESPGTPATHNTPYRAGKGYLYEGGLREPLIVRWPGTVAAGSKCDTPIVLTDLVPTLLEAAGIDHAKAVGPLDGTSIVELLREPSPGPGEGPGEGSVANAGPSATASRTLYWHFPNYTNQGGRPAGAIREGDWKLIEHFEDGSVELYNLAEDVGETNNLATAERERADNLRHKLHAWRASVGARMPTPNLEFNPEVHGRLYIEQDSSSLVAGPTAAATEPHWKAWRQAMNAATHGRTPLVTPAAGDIRLHARDAHTHGENLRYEPQPNKNVLGYWTDAVDWAEWEFEVLAPGKYEVEVQQGCGQGSGGARVAVIVNRQTLTFTVQETGHFQQMILLPIGEVGLTAGKHTLAVKPQTKPGAAVMDLRRIVLRPVQQATLSRSR